MPALSCSRHRSPSAVVRYRPPPRAPALPPGSSAAGLFPTVASLSAAISLIMNEGRRTSTSGLQSMGCICIT
ncbi:hypothetical protein Scep_030415 [Stephania cephalantha]|uniref:Uncharacterized protein n=1 Tax=Stephania cephalantha TaxID=152367 RepID=A0AAP0DZK1_9MAGN